MKMKRFLLVMIVLALLISLTGCQQSDGDDAPALTGQVVNVFNWEDYIAPETIASAMAEMEAAGVKFIENASELEEN